MPARMLWLHGLGLTKAEICGGGVDLPEEHWGVAFEQTIHSSALEPTRVVGAFPEGLLALNCAARLPSHQTLFDLEPLKNQ